ncbi:MAG: N-6 DNA methylase [Candidatus Heimdallarchaeota archaeon]|nr:MAG: N-6 DNA methylase [Candidatus Heimdallarchaeota archaeon]
MRLLNINTRQKKDLGAFYTPSQLAQSVTQTVIDQYLTHRLNSITSFHFISLDQILNFPRKMFFERLDDIIMAMKILDGAAGDGEFLRAAYTTLSMIKNKIDQRLSNSEKTLNLSSSLYGMEIDSKAVTSCQQSLHEVIFNDIQLDATEILRANIIQGNFLNCSFSSWENLSVAIKGFDIILGNPPWGGRLTTSQKEHYHKQFGLACPKRNINTASLFVYKATNLLANGGALAFLLPKNITRSNQYTFLREFMVTNFQINNLNFHGLFQDVTQEFISFIGFRVPQVPSDHKILINDKKIVPQASYLTNFDYIFTKEFDPHSQKIISRIQNDSVPLSHFVTIKRGEELSKKGGVMYCLHCSEWVPLSSRKPKITCPQCHRALQKEKLKIKFLITKYTDEHHTQPILTGDDFNPYMITGTHFIDPNIQFRSKKDPILYQSPKLVVQKIKRVPCAAYDPDGRWTTQNVYNIKLKSQYTNDELLYYILAVLNSSLYQWYYEYQFNLGSNYTNAISLKNLRRLPLKKPDMFNKIVQEIIDLAKKLSRDPETHLIEKLNQLVLKYYDCKSVPLVTLQN